MGLFTSVLEKIGIRLDKHEEEIAAIREELTDTKSRQDTYDDRLAAIESSLEAVIAGFELKYRELAQRTAGAKEQQKKDLATVRKEIDVFIQVVELSAEAQLDKARAQRVAKLLKTAKTRRTRLDNLLSGKAANAA